jgi:hypothetical protein
MFKFSLFLLFICFLHSINAQVWTVHGQVINKQTGTYLIGCSVYNVTKQMGTVANEEGRFRITVEKGDLIQFTYLGMGVKEQYIIDESELMIELYYQSRRIKPVTIKAEVTAKNSVLYNKKYDPNKRTFQEPVRRTAKEVLKQSSPSFDNGALVMSPFSLLYYSKKSVQRRMNAIIDIEKLDASNLKYSLDFIALVTKVEDRDELKDIKAYCYFPHDEVLNASYYDLGLKLQDCYIEYLEEKKKRSATDFIPKDR